MLTLGETQSNHGRLVAMNPYESRALVAQYLLFHYGTPDEIQPPRGVPPEALDFPRRTASIATDADADAATEANAARVLDLGCAVGRSAFELSRHAAEVIGIDFSQAFIDVANRLKAGESIPYDRLDEAGLSTTLTATAPGDANANPERITFLQGDAMNLPADLGTFDLVHAANLLCRLPEPLRLLERLPSLVNPGGSVLFTTPCTWLEEFTPRENWPPGRTLDYLREHLAPPFELAAPPGELPFLIREHFRKFQLSSAQTTLWRRPRE